ncbi:MAG: ferredoxin [Pseudomonadota bacterium]
MTGDDVATACAACGLDIVGAFHPAEDDASLTGIGTLFLLGPAGPAIWQSFETSPEALDGAPEPMDRWSRRVIEKLAADLDATAFFPFGGPPWQPFYRWATEGEGAQVSPVSMMASAKRGLWISYRGALGFGETMTVPAVQEAPCDQCRAPCRTACPISAFANGQYDAERCARHVLSEAGRACRDGCLVRRACPAGAGLDLPLEQRRFHMSAFTTTHGQEVPA